MEENDLDLLLADTNILEANISEVVTPDGTETVGLSLIVGMNDSQIESLLQLVGPDIVSKIPTGFEIVLTKEDLKKITKLVKEYE